MKKILSVLSSSLGYGGIASYVRGLYSEATSLSAEITIYCSGPVVNQDAKTHLEKEGVRVLSGTDGTHVSGMSAMIRRHLNIKRELRDVFKEGEYNIVHIHSGWPWFASMALKLAKREKIEKIIVHSHGTAPREMSSLRRIQQYIYRRKLKRGTFVRAACSDEAGRYLFGKRIWDLEGIKLRNGIDTERFRYSDKMRYLSRALANASGEAAVIGFSGRIVKEKNVLKLIEAFQEIMKVLPSAQLWIIGDGEEKEAMNSLAREKGIVESVFFWGNQKNVEFYLSGMDVFVMPSLNEGLGISVVEAEAAGLPCVVSDAVPSEVDFEGCCIVHVDVTAPADIWADAIMAKVGYRDRAGGLHVAEAGYDLSTSKIAAWNLYAD